MEQITINLNTSSSRTILAKSREVETVLEIIFSILFWHCWWLSLNCQHLTSLVKISFWMSSRAYRGFYEDIMEAMILVEADRRKG